jgi:hypothetical protein
MRLGVAVLPVGICGMVEGFGTGRTGGTAEPKPEGFDANSHRPLGFLARRPPTLSARSDDGTPSTFATLRVDRLAARETELTAPNLILL